MMLENKLATVTTKEYPSRILMRTKVTMETKENYTFKDNASLGWKCRNCGYIPSGSRAPEMCPVCSHPQAYFEEMKEKPDIGHKVTH
jgi:rubrerythrin